MEYILIDFENVKSGAIYGSNADREILVFVGENQKNMSVEFIKSAFPKGHNTELIQIVGRGNNAADFHIAFYIGKYASENPKASFRIISDDKGFDSLVAHLKSREIDCERIGMDSQTVARPKGGPVTLDDVCMLLDFLSPIKRPKTVLSLKNHLRSHFGADDASVEGFLSGLQSRKRISLAGGKLTYLVAAAG
jgi:hypothetical protein